MDQAEEYDRLCEYVIEEDVSTHLDFDQCIYFLESIEYKFPIHHKIILEDLAEDAFNTLDLSEIIECVIDQNDLQLKQALSYHFVATVNQEIEDYREAGEIMAGEEVE